MATRLQPSALSLRDLVDRFLNRPDLTNGSRNYYANVLANFAWFARAREWPDDPREITRTHFREFINYVATEEHRWPEARRPSYRKAKPATVFHYGKVVKTFFNWLEAEDYLDTNPTHKARLGAPQYQEVQPYSDDQVRAFLEVCDYDCRLGFRYLGLRNKAMISMFVGTGLRLSELASIRLPHLDPRLQQVWVMGKGAKPRIVPIGPEARNALRAYLQVRPEGSEELWTNVDGEPLTVLGIKTMVDRIKKRAGVTDGGGAHRFRHYFATKYLEAGGDINALRLLLGHSTMNMVLRYSRFIDVQRLVEGHEQFDPLERLVRGPKKNKWRWRY